MEQVVERSNLRLAYQRVVGNKGASGVDGVTVTEFGDWLKMHWPSVKAALLAGEYLPRPVRRVDIPKPSGGTRRLGVPTLLDRLIQQALHQVLQPLFEPTFSDGSFGFRPGRGAHQAVRRAQAHIRSGKRWVVDLDLEQFFDRVNHDVLMARVARPWERTFLGYSFTAHRESRLRIAPKSVHRFKQRVRAILRTGRGRSLSRTIEDLKPLLRGWLNYFQLTQTKGVLEQLDGWLRRRLRCLLWRPWKRPRTRASRLRARGLSAERARLSGGNGHGPWWNAGASHMNHAFPAAYFTRLGLVPLLATRQRLQRVR